MTGPRSHSKEKKDQKRGTTEFGSSSGACPLQDSKCEQL